MENIINVTGVHTTKFINGRKGKFRTVVKVRGGFMSVGDVEQTDYIEKDPTHILQSYQPKALQTVEFKPDDSPYWLTVFARTGKKVYLIDEDFLKHMTVGTVNSYLADTTLHNQSQYKAVNAKTWASKAFTFNK
jgi:hypothetical protein